MTNTPFEAVTEALRIRANVPFAGENQKKSASAAIEALRAEAKERLHVARHVKLGNRVSVEQLTDREIINAILGSPEENK